MDASRATEENSLGFDALPKALGQRIELEQIDGHTSGGDDGSFKRQRQIGRQALHDEVDIAALVESTPSQTADQPHTSLWRDDPADGLIDRPLNLCSATLTLASP